MHPKESQPRIREIIFTGRKMPRETYGRAADIIEAHPNYPQKKDEIADGGVIDTPGRYVAFCRERAKDNYTNEGSEDAQREYEKVLAFLDNPK